MKKLIMTVAIALVVVGCGGVDKSGPTPSPAPQGQPFLDYYIASLNGQKLPQDNACHPKTLADMLIAPCDSK